jgi:hypothetical protein
MSEAYPPGWDAATTFLSAAARDDAEKLSEMVAAGTSVNTRNTDGEPALLFAARLEKPLAAARLIDLGADVTATGPDGGTIVHLAGAYPKILPLLPDVLHRGAPLDQPDAWGQTPLMTAVFCGHVEGARAVLRLGANPLHRDKRGSTVVYRFIAGYQSFRPGPQLDAQLALLRDLIRAGIDPDAVGEFGKSPATLAAERGSVEVLKVLASEGAGLGNPDRTGLTPLQAATVFDQHETARKLLGLGVALDVYSAAGLGKVDEIGPLLDRDPTRLDAALPAADVGVLGLAIRFGHANLVRALLARGATPFARGRWNSSLHAAVHYLPDPQIVRLLIQRGAEVDASDGDGNTPLNFAAREGHLTVARVLLDAGANPNSETERGYTPLQFAKTDELRALLRARGGK